MDRGDTDKKEKDSFKSSSSEESPRAGVEEEKDENVLSREITSSNVDENEHGLHSEGKLEETNDSDSENPNKTSHYIVENESDSDSENQNNIGIISDNVERARGFEADNPIKTSSASTEVLVEEIESDSDSDKPNKIISSIDEVEKEIGSDSSMEKSSHTPDKVFFKENNIVSGSEIENNMIHAKEVVHDIEESNSDSENIRKITETTENIKNEESDSDNEEPNKRRHFKEEVHITDNERDLDIENLSRTSNAALDVHVVDKGNDSDSEILEKNSDTDCENLKKSSQITNEILFEEKEISLSYVSNEASRTVEIIEDKEVDPVFDGSEAPETESRRGSSTQPLDLNQDSQANTWPEKAAAIKNLVRMKGAIAVSNVFRRLSGGKEDVANTDEEEKNVIVEGPVEEPVMKGRIILYTRLGCQESKEIRSLMHQKGLNYVEINVDIFPGRKLELEKNTGSSAVPRVYLNEFLVGGLSELKSMNESGKFDVKIHDLMNEEPSNEAPLPPFPGEDDFSASGKVDELASIVRKMKESIVLSDRFYKLRRFNSCFVGSEAIDFLVQDQDLEREEAVNLGRKLVKGLFFRHVLEENVFEDGNHLYRFLEHDPSISTNCFNMTRGINELKPKRVTEIASRLRFLSFAIFEAYVSEDGRHVDYRSIHDSEEFKRYLRIVEELQRVELDNISREEKLAFFLNLYNMMAIHAILTWGYPAGTLDRKRFLGEYKYVIGGCTYSLSAIQNGILRGNQRPPYNISKPFGPKDMRYKVALPYAEPLVHFALVCGNRSGPPLRCYSPGNIDMELMESARIFLRNGGLIVDAEAKTASASSIIRWYSADFGKNEAEVMKHLSNYLEPSKSQELLDLLADNQLRVTYQPYDWGSNN